MQCIGYTTGVFDMFHIGHLNLLRRARMHCDYLIVGVSTDALVKKLKHRRPIIPFSERVDIVQSVRYVDKVVPEETADKMDAWAHLKFNVIFKGDDWKGTEQWKRLEEQFHSVGVEVVYFPYTSHTSSTQLREALEKIYETASGK